MKKASAAILALLVQFSPYAAFADAVKPVQKTTVSQSAAYTAQQAAKNAKASLGAVDHAATIQQLSNSNASAAFADIQITGADGAPALVQEQTAELANPTSASQTRLGFNDLQLFATVNAFGARVYEVFDAAPGSATFGQKIGQITDPTGNQDLGTKTGLLGGKYMLLSETVNGVTVFHAYDTDRASATFLQEAFQFADPTPAGNPSDFGGSFSGSYAIQLLSNNLLVVSDKDASGRGVLHVFDMRKGSATYGQHVTTVESPIAGGSLLGMHSSIFSDTFVLVEGTDGTGPTANKTYHLIVFMATSQGVSVVPAIHYTNPDAFGSQFGKGRVQYVGANLLVEAKDAAGRTVFHLFNLAGSLIKTIADTDAPEQGVFGTSGVLVANNYLLVRDTDTAGNKVIRAFNLTSQPGQLAFTLQAGPISGTFGSGFGGLYQDPANPELLFVTDVMYGVDVRYVYDLRSSTTGNRLIGGYLMPAPIAHSTNFPISLGSGLLLIKDKTSGHTYHVLDTKLDSPTFGKIVSSFTLPGTARGISVSVDSKNRSRIKIILTDSLGNSLFTSLRIVR